MRIVLSASKKVKEKVFQIAKELENAGYEAVVPQEFIVPMEKKEASMKHFSEIAKPETDVVLAVNEAKNGILNYIGPNTFAEIAMGFFYQKKVYVLYEYYEPYVDELTGWDVIPLHGDIANITEKK